MNPTVLVFRYIPKSCYKDGEPSFSKCATLESVIKPISKFKEINCHILKNQSVLPHKAI